MQNSKLKISLFFLNSCDGSLNSLREFTQILKICYHLFIMSSASFQIIMIIFCPKGFNRMQEVMSHLNDGQISHFWVNYPFIVLKTEIKWNRV